MINLQDDGVEIYQVGGYIRDILLGRECFDRDYVIKGMSAIEFAGKVAESLQGTFILLDTDHDIARVVLPDKLTTLDFAGCVGEDIYTDLANRDYTINAIASDGCKLIDPFNGKRDIENKLIKAISEKNLMDDPIRLLRGFRLAAQFDFTIEDNTLGLISKHHELINNVAVERINVELIKLLQSNNAAKFLDLMKSTGILYEIFPALVPVSKIPPNLHHHLYLIDHSIETVRQVEENITKFQIPPKKTALLKLAALLHDIGKPSTWSIDEEGRHRFIKHEDVGAEMVLEELKRLKFSKKDIKYISLLIKNHLYPSQLIREGVETLSDKAVMRFFRKLNEVVPELLLLALSDRKSALGPEITPEIVKNNVDGTYALLGKYRRSEEEIQVIPKLASGEDVMEICNIEKGPLVGKVLSALKEAQLSGEISTRSEALNFIKAYKLHYINC